MIRSTTAAVAFALITLVVAQAQAADWYVSPRGTPFNDGSRAKPWPLGLALGGERPIQPGDTIYLMEGVYRQRPVDRVVVKLIGAEGKPIVIRPEPGAHAVIDGGLRVDEPSRYVWIRDLEIMVSEPKPDRLLRPTDNPADFGRPSGGLELVGGRNCKYINLVIHDCLAGIVGYTQPRPGALEGFLSEIDAEIYGCVIYHNGLKGTERGFGHAINIDNDEGTKVISDNIFVANEGGSFFASGGPGVPVNNLLIRGNIAYNSPYEFIIGSRRPAKNIRVMNNFVHNSMMLVGIASYNEDCEVFSNVVIRGRLIINRFNTIAQENNIVLREGSMPVFGVIVSWLPNEYDDTRSNLVVIDLDEQGAKNRAAARKEQGMPDDAPDMHEVVIPGSPFLQQGDKYRLYEPTNLRGEPVASGVYDGEKLTVPAKGEFTVFVAFRERP